MDWFKLTPESITGIAQIVLAITIAIYLFSIPGKNRGLWLLAFSVIGETLHHTIKFAEFTLPYLFPPVSSFLFIPSFIIYVLIIAFAYEFKERIYVRESRVILLLTTVIGLALSGYILFVYTTGRPHNALYGTETLLTVILCYLLFTSSWGIVVLLRKARFFYDRHRATPLHNDITYVGDRRFTQPDLLAARSCIGFSAILSIKIIILLMAVLSQFEIVTAYARIYANLVLHVVYLFGLVVVIMDHVQHPTSLQAKLIGFTLSIALLILSVLALTTYSTDATLELSRSIIPDQQEYVFTRADGSGYAAYQRPMRPLSQAQDPIPFSDRENISVTLPFPFPFYDINPERVFVNRNGVLAFQDPFSLRRGEEYYMTQTSHHYSPILSRQFAEGTYLAAPLFIRSRTSESDTLYITSTDDFITFLWKNIQQDDDGIQPYVDATPQYSSFYTTLFSDGTIVLGHLDVNAYLYDGAVGLLSGKTANSPVVYARNAFELPIQASLDQGIVLDIFRQFRSGIHQEVSRFLFILIGAILLIFLVFPLISRTSIFRPLKYLLLGVKQVEQGLLATRVPVTTRDEIGYLTDHFNQMVDSLQGAREKLMAHNEDLEREVTARTEEVMRQKRQIEIQARELIEMDEVKSRFFTNLSHEFRTPLNLIMGPVQFALEGKYGELDPTLREHHITILNESRRLLKLINQLLDLSKFDAGMLNLNASPIDLVLSVSRIVRNFSSRAALEKKTLSFHSDLAHLPGLLDPEKLENICYNLIDNAFKFTEEGGKILVTVQLVEEEDRIDALISFQDTGKGIPPDMVTQIFNRFQQVDSNGSSAPAGTGIGLALVEKLVTLHQGTIEVDSTPGFGSTFNVRLPVPEKDERDQLLLQVSRAPETPEVPERSYNRKQGARPTTNPVRAHDEPAPTLLIVDDDEQFRTLLTEYLYEFYNIEEAAHGKEGLEKARKHPPHVIISDVMMPVMDGLALCKAIKEDPDLDHIPFIMLTARASIESRIEGIEQGADVYLAKPFHPGELHAIVENRLIQRRNLIEKYSNLVQLGATDIVVDSAEGAFIKDVMRSIEKNLGDYLYSVERLADDVEVSVRDLQRKLRKTIDQSPKDLIMQTRIDRAKQLLEQRYGSNQQIAHVTGFRRADHFARVFKKYCGVTPGEYASQQQSSDDAS